MKYHWIGPKFNLFYLCPENMTKFTYYMNLRQFYDLFRFSVFCYFSCLKSMQMGFWSELQLIWPNIWPFLHLFKNCWKISFIIWIYGNFGTWSDFQVFVISLSPNQYKWSSGVNCCWFGPLFDPFYNFPENILKYHLLHEFAEVLRLIQIVCFILFFLSQISINGFIK